MKWRMSLGVAVFSCLICRAALSEVITDPVAICDAAKAWRAGAWLDEPALKRCLMNDVELEKLRQEIGTLLAKDKAQRDHIDYLSINLAHSAEEIEEFKQVSIMQQLENKDLRNELDSWYRNPWIIGLVGAAAGAAATATVLALVLAR